MFRSITLLSAGLSFSWSSFSVRFSWRFCIELTSLRIAFRQASFIIIFILLQLTNVIGGPPGQSNPELHRRLLLEDTQPTSRSAFQIQVLPVLYGRVF